MVEVLVPGTKNRMTCDFCGAILSYDKGDIKENERFLSARNSYFEKYIVCPQCKYRNVLEAQR